MSKYVETTPARDNRIRIEALHCCGKGQKSAGFELGAEWALTTFPHINDLAQQAHDTAVRRGKTSDDASHLDTFFSILSELKEFREASEINPSEHLPQYTQTQEELADIIICGFTELYKRGVDVEEIVMAKIEFNKVRDGRKENI